MEIGSDFPGSNPGNSGFFFFFFFFIFTSEKFQKLYWYQFNAQKYQSPPLLWCHKSGQKEMKWKMKMKNKKQKTSDTGSGEARTRDLWIMSPSC